MTASTNALKIERLLREAEELGHTGSWEHDLVGGEIFSSDENRRLFFGDDPSKGRNFADYTEAVHPEDRKRVLASHQKLLDGEHDGDIEYRVLWPDGSVHTIFGRARVTRDERGKPIRTMGTNVDVTDRRLAEAELYKKNNELLALSRRLVGAHEAERRAIARELHDDLGQVLTAIKLNLHATARSAGPSAAASIEESIALVAGAIDRVRTLARDLRPPALDELGLGSALISHLDQEARRGGFEIAIDVEEIAKSRFDPALEIACFRLVQEAITNIQRHANAHRVEVTIKTEPAAILVRIRDDGKGFDVEAARRRVASGESLGLLGLEERVSIAGGRLSIESSPGQGTTIDAWLPRE